jgi:hypothetical protein
MGCIRTNSTDLVDAGIIRFGAVDDTEGGSASRTNVNVAYTKAIDDITILKQNSFIATINLNCFLISLFLNLIS